MGAFDLRDMVWALQGRRAGQRNAQVVRPVITTRQATADPSIALVAAVGTRGAVSLNSSSGGARFMWGVNAPFGWDSGEWD